MPHVAFPRRPASEGCGDPLSWGGPSTASEPPHTALAPRALAVHAGTPRHRGTVHAELHHRARAREPHSEGGALRWESPSGPLSRRPLNVSVSCSRTKAAPASSCSQAATQLPHLLNGRPSQQTPGPPPCTPASKAEWALGSPSERETLPANTGTSTVHSRLKGRVGPGASCCPHVLLRSPGGRVSVHPTRPPTKPWAADRLLGRQGSRSPTPHPGTQVLPGGSRDEER